MRQPKVFLFDEPLSNLDAKLRIAMRVEIRKLQRRLSTTSIYVTHDQLEAMTLADILVVMNGGRVEQIGSPREIYDHPQTAFVADFIGSLNAFDVTVDEVVGEYSVAHFGETERVVVAGARRRGERVRVAVRPEHVHVGEAVDGGSVLRGTLSQLVYLGMYTQLHVETDAGLIVSHRLADESATRLEQGVRVVVSFAPEDARLLDSSA